MNTKLYTSSTTTNMMKLSISVKHEGNIMIWFSLLLYKKKVFYNGMEHERSFGQLYLHFIL